MKCLRFLIPLILFSLFIVPAALAFPGDCWETCPVTEACNSPQAAESCVECIWQYDETQCIEWRSTTCQETGACGQCAVLATWTEIVIEPYAILPPLRCDTKPNPDVPYDAWARSRYRYYYQRKRCNGVETVEMYRREYVSTVAGTTCLKPKGGSCVQPYFSITPVTSSQLCPF